MCVHTFCCVLKFVDLSVVCLKFACLCCVWSGSLCCAVCMPKVFVQIVKFKILVLSEHYCPCAVSLALYIM